MTKDIVQPIFHYFSEPIEKIPLPEKFTCPFHYTPHPLCIIAAKEVQEYLKQQEKWQEELEKGKMFGVMIVQTANRQIGYLAAFSGLLANKGIQPFFVPPIYDLQQPYGFFKAEEKNISALNKQIQALETDKHYLQICETLEKEKKRQQENLAETKKFLQEAKKIRENRRQNNPDEAELNAMIQESQYQKAEFKRLKLYWKKRIASIQAETDSLKNNIEHLKTERKTRSAILQQKLFEQFKILNNQGETKTLPEIFEVTPHKTPPAGAGDCAAPKLLQYAYLHHLQPIAMAEFWWGHSPTTELRRHGYYYPACKGKCEPILNFMLEGLEVEDNPLITPQKEETEIEILYEDEWLLVINKPNDILSVPGKSKQASIWQLVKERYPEATGPLLVHRLDMATSGLLLIAKDKNIHKALQIQFRNHTIQKGYIALLDGAISTNEGTIDLPLCLDPQDRPRQLVNYEYGKSAVTQYQVLEHRSESTLIAFFPLTGRTHQLRVHAAHPLGLNTPILGDELYGRKSNRLYLHANYLEFRHPINGKIMHIKKDILF